MKPVGSAKIGAEITRGNVNGRAGFHRPAACWTNLFWTNLFYQC